VTCAVVASDHRDGRERRHRAAARAIAISGELALAGPRSALRQGRRSDALGRLRIPTAHHLRGGPRDTRRGLSRAGHEQELPSAAEPDVGLHGVGRQQDPRSYSGPGIASISKNTRMPSTNGLLRNPTVARQRAARSEDEGPATARRPSKHMKPQSRPAWPRTVPSAPERRAAQPGERKV